MRGCNSPAEVLSKYFHDNGKSSSRASDRSSGLMVERSRKTAFFMFDKHPRRKRTGVFLVVGWR